MMKGLIFHQQQQQQLLDENMSNLTSQSGTELASVSSGNIRAEANYQAQAQAQAQPPAKKKRNLPGNPDPDAEVIALSPKSLMATNRFVCEICNKGFQREQNLQLHRRGHNLPWKLKQRTNKEVIRKKVYLCPEPNCVHHDPSRALGDLTGIKKHFCRKHGEKKWKCDKCSKRYAVQSDWKAHSKICGTREYRCDCGTLFSRRDSFITHRAFCDALAEESGRTNPLLISSSTHLHHLQPGAGASSNVNLQMIPQFNPQETFHPFSLKKEQQSFSLPGQEMSPLWLASQQQPIVGAAGPGPPPPLSHTVDHLSSSSSSSVYLTHQDLSLNNDHPNPNPSCLGPTLNIPSPNYQQAAMASPHMSATALLQKATKMGGTMSIAKTSTATAGNSSSSHASALIHGLAPFGHKAADSSGGGSGVLIQEMMMNNYGAAAASFDDEALTFCGMLNSKKDHHHHHHHHDQSSSNGGGEGLTRDFLGLRALSQTDILNIINASSREQQQQQQNHSQYPW